MKKENEKLIIDISYGWQPIKDVLPKFNEQVKLARMTEDNKDFWVTTGVYREYGLWSIRFPRNQKEPFLKNINPTHWKPLND